MDITRVPGRRLLLIALAAAVLAACGGGGGRGGSDLPPRSYLMGFSSLAQDRTDAAYKEAFHTIGLNGELVMIQRSPPWKDFMEGASPSDQTRRAMEAETQLVRDNKLQLLFAVDPIDSTLRDRPARLPPEWAGYGFGRAELVNAYIRYVQWVAANYKPDYMSLMSEVDMYAVRNMLDFNPLVSLYGQAYDAVKAVSPNTLVFPTFQYEDLLGGLGKQTHRPAWSLVDQFAPKMDLMAITTYPNFNFQSAGDIPADYYQQIRDHTSKPIVFAEAGFSSEKVEKADASEPEQDTFLRRLFDEADALASPFLVWYAIADPRYDMPSPAFQHIGLLRDDGSEKAAWKDWRGNLRRPVQGGAG